MPKRLTDKQDKFNMVISDDLVQHLGPEQVEFLLAKILELTADAVISVDEDSRIVLFNQGAEEMFGYDGSEIVGKSLDELIPEDRRDAHAHHIKEFKHRFEGKQCAWSHMEDGEPLQARKKTGECFPIEASISKFEYMGRTYYSAIVRDVSQKSEAENEIALYRKRIKKQLLREVSEVARLKVDTNSRMLKA